MGSESLLNGMKCIERDLRLFELPSLNAQVLAGHDASLFIFNGSQERTQLLLEILSYIDEDLKTMFEHANGEKLIQKLMEIYVALRFITEDEESFITGKMSLESQMRIWLDIISCLNDIKKDDSPSRYSNNVDLIHSLILNPLIKRTLNVKVVLNSYDKTPIEKINFNSYSEQQLEYLENSISLLEDAIKEKTLSMVTNEDLVNSSTWTAKSDQTKHYDYNNAKNLISEWMEKVETILKLKPPQTKDESEFEQISKDLSETVVSLHELCTSFSEFISNLQAIKNKSKEILMNKSR